MLKEGDFVVCEKYDPSVNGKTMTITSFRKGINSLIAYGHGEMMAMYVKNLRLVDDSKEWEFDV